MFNFESSSVPIPNLGKLDKCEISGCSGFAYSKAENGKKYCLEHYAIILDAEIRKNKEDIKRAKEEAKKQKEVEAKKISSNQYAKKKEEFEKMNFIIGSELACIESNGKITHYPMAKASVKYENVYFQSVNKHGEEIEEEFFKKWRKDPERKQYSRIDFIPKLDECPADVFNLFDGFQAEKLEPVKDEINQEELIKPILELMNYITGGYQKDLSLWIAGIIQRPWQKTQLAQFIRDEGSLFTSGGGCGKNTFFDFLGNNILGEKYYHLISNNKEMFNDFNGITEGKILILVEEASGKDNHANASVIKSTITKKKNTINKKGINQYSINDYSNWIFTTNERNALPIKQEDRRFAVYDSNPVMRDNVEYFNNLVKLMNNPEVQYCFYNYHKNLSTYGSPIEFQKNIAITGAYKDIRQMNAPVIQRYISSPEGLKFIKNEFSLDDLYNKFYNWCCDNREGSGGILTKRNLGLLLAKDDCFTKRHTMYGNMYKTDMDKLIINLKKLYLIPEEEQEKQEEQ